MSLDAAIARRLLLPGLTLLAIAGAGPSALRAETAFGEVSVRVLSGGAPVSAAEISAAGAAAQSDARGEARLELPTGERELLVQRHGFAPATVDVTVAAGETVAVTVQLTEQRFEDSVTVVAATRSGRMVEDQAIRVETLPQEEIEENSTLAPGNLSNLLNEIGGVRVQTVSPALGGANLRLLGLSGRYTTILSDELPLHGAQPDAFALLQVPPLDLARAEVIEGAASALYGGSALSGLVNLVSRRPDGEPEALVSQSLHGGTDAAGFLPHTLGPHSGYTLLASANRQVERDLDDDGWADLPGYERGVVRPRLFWDDHGGHTLFATLGGTVEHREGGTVPGAATPDGSPFVEELDTGRLDGGLVGRFLVRQDELLAVHLSFSRAHLDHRFGAVRERDRRTFGLAELSLSGGRGGHTWVVGGALDHRGYRFEDVAGFDSAATTPALFVQDEYSPSRRWSIAASARADFDRVGTFVDPRLSALLRPAGPWTLRLSVGTGYAAPVPVLDETEAVGLSRVLPLADLTAERARSVSFDVGRSHGRWELDETLFTSRVREALQLRPAVEEAGRFEIVNAPAPTDVYGSRFLVRYTREPLQIIGTHFFVRSLESDPEGPGRRETPLTPRHSLELAVLAEEESRGRIGLELSYTGRQSLEIDPYRAESPPYLEIDLLGELRLGEAHVFLNATNLGGVRQTDFDPLLLPQRAPDGRWTTDLWAPLEGRSVNAGVRVEL